MSNYSSEPTTCTCDTPTGSESRRCSYCKESTNEKSKKKKRKTKK